MMGFQLLGLVNWSILYKIIYIFTNI